MLETYGQLLVDMLDELCALKADLEHFRRLPSPPPFGDEWQFVTKRRSTYVGEFFVVRGRFLMFWSCGAFRLYLGASYYIYIFWLMLYFLFLIGLSMIGGDTLMIYVSCFRLFIYLYLWGYSWYMSLFLCYVKSSYFVLLVFSTYAFMHLLSDSGIYRLNLYAVCVNLL